MVARTPDNLWQEGNDGFRQCRKQDFTQRRKQDKDAKKSSPLSFLCAFALFAPLREILGSVACAGGEFARVFGATAGTLVSGSAARGGLGPTALVAHLGR